jgi:hypothetical protein
MNGNNALPELPPLWRDQRKADGDHLRLLAIFHFLFAGLALAGIGFLCLHYALLHTVFANLALWKTQPHPPPFPVQQFFAIFRWFYVIVGALLILGGLLNLLSGLFIQRRKFRTYSLVVAALDCLQIPMGTILGVFTIIVLLRDSVRELYEGAERRGK